MSVLVVLSGCTSSDSEGAQEQQKRTTSLRIFGDDFPGVTHVADFNDRTGPASETVAVPADAPGYIVRFDCIGPGKRFHLNVVDFVEGAMTCGALSEFGYKTGGSNAKGDPIVMKGQSITAQVKVDADVRWSLSVDLAYSKATFEMLRDDQ